MPHTLNTKDQWFLKMGCKDPLTGGRFQTGDSVVVCRKCRTVHLVDTNVTTGMDVVDSIEFIDQRNVYEFF